MARHAGRLNRRITLQSNAGTQDTTHGDVGTNWTTLATVWAAKLDLSGGEQFQGNVIDGRVTTEWRIDYRTDVTAKMRVNDGGTHYDIEAVMEGEGRNTETVLQCVRRGG